MIEEEIPAALGGERLDRIVSLITDCSRSDAAALVAAASSMTAARARSSSGEYMVPQGLEGLLRMRRRERGVTADTAPNRPSRCRSRSPTSG